MALRTSPRPLPLALFFGTALIISLAGVAASAVFWLVSLDVATAEKISWLHATLRSMLSEPQRALLTDLGKDASTITPLILLMFFLGGLRGSWSYFFYIERIPRQLARSRGAYPFPARYQSTWIQLGLIGTLWSFLLIGTRLKFGIDPAESVTILVIAFGTALLSTFAGVVGAYVLGPLVSTVFRGALARSGLHAESTPSLLREVTAELGELAAGVATASLSLGTPENEKGGRRGPAPSLSLSLDETTRAFGRLREQVDALDPEAALGRWTDALIERLTGAWDERVRHLERAIAADREALGRELRSDLRTLIGQHERSRQEFRLAIEQAEQQRATAESRRQELLSSGLKDLGRDLAALVRPLEAAAERRSQELARVLEVLPQRLATELTARWPRSPAARRHRPRSDAELISPTPQSVPVESVGKRWWPWPLRLFTSQGARRR